MCLDHEEQRVQAAALPPQIIQKSLASNQVVIDLMVRKHCDHIPLYRHSAIKAGHRFRTEPSDAGWVGDENRRAADFNWRLGHAARVAP